MNSVVAALVAAFVGAAAHFVVMWSPVFGAPSTEGVINTVAYTLLLAPANFVVLGFGLFGLSRVAPAEPVARWIVVCMAAVAVPLFLANLVDTSSETGWGPQIMAAIGPYLLAAVVFLVLTRRTAAAPAQPAAR